MISLACFLMSGVVSVPMLVMSLRALFSGKVPPDFRLWCHAWIWLWIVIGFYMQAYEL